MNRRYFALVLSVAAFVSTGVVEGGAQTLMTRHVRDVTLNAQAKVLGRLPATRIMQLNIVLPLRDEAGLDALLAELSKCEIAIKRVPLGSGMGSLKS